MEYTSYEIFEVGSKTACQTWPVYPRGRTIMIHWMNTLFVLRNLFPVKRFCAINLAQQHIFPREVARTIVCLSKSHLPSIKNHSFKSIFSVSEKATMSGCGAENSSILDNLRKSVKEQVCIYIFFWLKYYVFRCLFHLVSNITHVTSRTDVDERAAGTLRSISLLSHFQRGNGIL